MVYLYIINVHPVAPVYSDTFSGTSRKWMLMNIYSNTKNTSLHWCHNDYNGISNDHRLNYLLNCLFRHRSKKTSKLCITGLCERNPLVISGFPPQRASNVENVSIWWLYHVKSVYLEYQQHITLIHNYHIHDTTCRICPQIGVYLPQPLGDVITYPSQTSYWIHHCTVSRVWMCISECEHI